MQCILIDFTNTILRAAGISQVEGLVVGLYRNSTKLIRAHDCIIETLGELINATLCGTPTLSFTFNSLNSAR